MYKKLLMIFWIQILWNYSDDTCVLDDFDVRALHVCDDEDASEDYLAGKSSQAMQEVISPKN